MRNILTAVLIIALLPACKKNNTTCVPCYLKDRVASIDTVTVGTVAYDTAWGLSNPMTKISVTYCSNAQFEGGGPYQDAGVYQYGNLSLWKSNITDTGALNVGLINSAEAYARPIYCPQ